MDVREFSQGKIGPLEVRNRHTVSASGSVSSQATVYCPVRERSLSIKKCALCDFFGGTADEGRGTELRCHRPSSDLPRHACDEPGAPKCAAMTPVSKIMKSVVCVRPELEVEDLEKLLLEHSVSGVPVVDEKGFLTGVVSKTDLVRHEKLENEQWIERMGEVRMPAKVAEVMMRHPASIRETGSIAEAIELMLTHGIHRLPVVSEAGEVLAIVTPLDVLDWIAS